MENASGGYMSDLSFCGGRFGAWLGNQQFTVRNLRFEHCQTAIYQHWNWAWTYVDIHINHCMVGIHVAAMQPDRQGVGSLVLSDWHAEHTGTLVQLERQRSGRLVLEHVRTEHVPQTVAERDGPSLLAPSAGSTGHSVDMWLHTPEWTGAPPVPLRRPASMVDPHGRWFGREKPLYTNVSASEVVSIRCCGARGDGKSDDTAALQAALDQHAGRSLIFVPHGVYVVTDTLHVPVGTQMTGEALPVVLGTGDRFNDPAHPRAVVQVGRPGDAGELVISNMIFSTRAPAAGAVVLEWNVREAWQGSVAMFDSHVRIGGFRGTLLEHPQCDKTRSLEQLPRASLLNLHVTPSGSGYFQNVWVWTADHDLDFGERTQINVLSERGVLIEARDGPVWMYGTASEHQLLYQYSLVGASNVLLAMIQTETPYFQGHGFARASESALQHGAYPDPDTARSYKAAPECPNPAPDPALEDRAVGLHVERSEHVFVLGAGLYSFFDAYGQDTLPEHACQRRQCTLDNDGGPSKDVWLMNLATIGSVVQLAYAGCDAYGERRFREGFCSTTALCVLGAGAEEPEARSAEHSDRRTLHIGELLLVQS